MNNDLTGLQKKTNQNNDINAVRTLDTGTSGINMDYIANNEIPQLEQDTNTARDQAMQSYIAGLPEIQSPSLTVATQKPDIDESTISKSFSTRDQIMSKLGLMDENYNYTDTYTNYIQQGGAPLPGYEYAHQELLDQERYDQIFQKVDQGEMSYDTALMEAYGKDILATMGYDVTSVAYWQNKFYNNDFSNPFTNRYLMDQVKAAAEDYHQQRLAGEYGNKKAKDTQLASLIGDDLSMKQIKDLFASNWSDQIKSLDDTKLLQAIHTGQLSQSLRLTKDSEGTYYYLHTDGQLYKCDNQSGDGHASITLKSDGTPESIEIGSTHLKAFTSGFAGVFTGLAKLATNIIQFSAEGLSVLWDGDFDIDNATSWANAIDDYLGDNVNWATDSGYVDFDESFSWKDATHLGCSLLGTIAGTMALGAGTNFINTKAMSLISSENKIARVAGYGLKGITQAQRWSTGAFGDYGLGQSALHVWGMRAGAAGMSAFKNMLQDVNKMNWQRMMSDDPSKISDGQIFGRALQTNAINFGVDLLISGGMQDNQWQAYTGRNTVTKAATDNYRTFLNELKDEASDKVIEESLKSDVFKQYMRSSNWVIRFNTAADFIGNLATAGISKGANINKDGEFEKATLDTLKVWDTSNLATTMQAAFNSYYYSYRSQKKDRGYNLAFNNLRSVNDTILNELDNKIKSTKNADQIKTLTEVKQNYLKDIQDSKAATIEGKILQAVENLDSHIKTKDNEVSTFIQKAFDKAINPAKVEMYKKMYDVAEQSYFASLTRANEIGNPTKNSSGLIKSIMQRAYYGFTGESKAISNIKKERQYSAYTAGKIKEQCDILNKYLEYANNLDKINANITNEKTRAGMNNNIRFRNGLELKDQDPKLFEKMSGMSQAELSKTYFITVANDAVRDQDYQLADAALDIARKFEYVTLVDEDTHTYAYQIDDGEDFLNASTKLQTITNGVLAISQSPEKREEILTAMINNLDYTAEYEKQALSLNVIDTLREKKILNDREAIKILDDTIGLNKTKNLSRLKTNDMNKILTKYVNMKEVLTAIANSQKGEAKVNMGDPEIRDAVQELLKNKTIDSNLKDELKRIAKDESFFLSGDAQGFRAYLDFEIKNKFKVDKELSPDTFIDTMSDKDLKSGLELYVKTLAPESNEKERVDFVNKLLTDMKKTYDNTTTVTMRDNFVILNLDAINGKYTNALIKDVHQRAEASYKGYADPKKFDNHAQVAKELDAKSNLIINSSGYSPMQYIDITKAEDRQVFNNIMAALNYDIKLTGDTARDKLTLSSSDVFGMSYYQGDRTVMKMPESNLQETLEKAFSDGYLTVGNKTIPLGKIEYFDANGNKVINKPDVVTAILSNVELYNLDPNLTLTLNKAPIMGLLPYMPQEEYHKDTLVTAILHGTEALGMKRGKMAGMSTELAENSAVKTIASVVEQDKTLANFLAINEVVNYLSDNTDKVFRINDADLKQIKELGLIDTEDSFWQSSNPKKSTEKYIMLKPDVTKEQLQDYILAKDFNMYKLLPLIGYTETDAWGQDMTTQQTKIQSARKGQLPRNTLLDILNIDFPWDNNEQDFKKEFFKKYLDGSEDYKYNPIKGHKYKYNDASTEAQDWDSYIASIQKSKDPYNILINRYIETFNEMAKAQEGTKPEMWRLLLKNKKITQQLVNTDELTDDLKQQIKDIYANAQFVKDNHKIYNNRRSVYSSNSYQQPSGTVTVGTDILSDLLGGYDNIAYKIYNEGKLETWVPEDLDIEQAFNKAKEFQAIMSEDKFGSYQNYISARFEQNPVMRILTTLGSSDGYVAIEDCDELAYLIAENYRDIMDNKSFDIKDVKYNDGVKDLFKAIYGKNSDKAIEIIFNKAKLLGTLETEASTEWRKEVKTSSPSQTLTRSYDISKDGSNLKTMQETWDAYIDRQRKNQREDRWGRLADSVSDVVDYYTINKGARNRELEDRLFEMKFPGNSISHEFTKDYNSNGPQYVAINTMNKLKEVLDIKDKDENLMNTSITLTNLHYGNTSFTGSTTNYAVIDKEGNLLDMETFGRDNLTDMLNPILNNKKSLIGSTVVFADNQDLTDITALNLRTRTIANEQDYKDLVNDAYQSWAYDNMFYLKKALNANDSLTVLEMLPQIKQDKMQELLEYIPRTSISEKEESLSIWKSVEPYWSMDKKDFYKLYKGVITGANSFENKEATYNSILRSLEQDLDITKAYDKMSSLERRTLDAITYAMSNDLFDGNERQAMRAIKSSILEGEDLVLASHVKDYMNGDATAKEQIQELLNANPELGKRRLALAFLAYEDNTSNSDFLTRNNRSLVGMDMIRNRKATGSSLVISNKGDTLPTKDVESALSSMRDNTENTSKYNTLIWYDTETTNIKQRQNNMDSVFSVAFYIKKYEDGQWNTYEVDAFLKHNEDPETWFKNNINTKDAFYLDNPAFKDYANKYRTGDGEFFDAESLRNELLRYIDPGKTLMFGHNADNSDLPWLTKNGVFTNDLLKTIKHVDTIHIAATNLKDERAKKTVSNQGLFEYFFGKQDNSAHGALADAKVTAQLTDKLVSTQYNIDYLKTKELSNLENFMKEFGVELNKQDLKAIDEKIKQVKEDNKENLDCFKRDYTISTDKVAALSYAFSHAIQKEYPKLVFEAFNQDYKLSSESEQSIFSGDYTKIYPILAYANENGILRNAYTAIKDVATGEDHYLTDDKIIKTISSDYGINQIKKQLGITDDYLKDISTNKIKNILSQDISKDSAISEEELKTFNDLKGTYNFVKSLKTFDDIIQDPFANRIIKNAFLTPFDFSRDIEDLDGWLNSKTPTFIESSYDQQRREILEGSFGDVRALFSIPVAGKYSLITSFNVDDTYKDVLTGQEIISDSSMAIVSKDYFESLMGESLDNYRNKGELYTNLLIHPADGNNKIHACRIIVDENAEGMSLRIPETVAETMLARDFDGDHTILIKPDADSQTVLKEYSNNIYKAHDIQEKTLNWLKHQGLRGTKNLDVIYSQVGRDEDVIDICRKADKLLAQGKKIPNTLTSQFEKAVTKALKDNTDIKMDDIKNALWIQDFNTSNFENKERHLVYVKNPAVTLTDKFIKSHSAEIIQEIDALTEQQINKYLPIDSATGEIQKQFILNAKAQKVDKVFGDMISNDIYGSKVVTDYISRLNPTQVKEFVEFTKENIDPYRTKAISTSIDKTLQAMETAAEKNNLNTVKACYDALLRTVEVDLKDSTNKKIMKALGSEETQRLWNKQRDILASKEKGVKLVNEYRNKTKQFYSAGNDPYTDAKFNYVLNDAVKETEFDNRIKYVDDFRNRETCKTFVVTGGWPAAQDEILTNNNSVNPFSVWRSERLTFNPSDKVQSLNGEKIKPGDILPAGFAITKDSKSNIKLETKTDSQVLYVNLKDKTIVIASKDSLDGQVKIVTNEGSKGPVNNSFSIDDKDTTLIVNQDTMKREKLVTSNGTPIDYKEDTRIITDSHGNKYTVKGYFIEDVVPTLTEDAKQFNTKNTLTTLLKPDDLYRIDHLHHCSDSKSVEGSTLMGGWYLYMKDGQLHYDPSRVQNMIQSLDHPERLVQAHNMIDGLQYMRMAYVLEQRTEEELQQIFKTNLSKQRIIQNKLNDVRVGSENYNAEINWFVNKYGIHSDNETIKKLFSNSFDNLLTGMIQTGSEGVNINKHGGKSGIGSRTAVNEKGETTSLYSRGKVDSPELYNANMNYDESYDDYYVPALKAYKYLFGDITSSSQLFDWARKGLVNRGRYYADANVSNGFKNTNEQYVQERNPMDTWAHHGIGTSPKSAALMNPFYYNVLSDLGIEPSITDNKYLITHSNAPENSALYDSINRGTTYNNDVMISKILHSLGSITPNMSSRDKLNVLNDDKIFTISQMIPYYGVNPETNEMELRMTNPQDYSSDAKGIAKRINSSIHDFNYAFKVYNKKDLNLDSLYENIDSDKAVERIDNYKQKRKEADEALDNISKSLVNATTGEINENISVDELYKDKNKARVAMPEVVKDKDKELIFKKDPLLLTGSGLKEDNPDTISLGRAYKKQNSYATYISQDALNKLTGLQETITKSGISEQEFEDFSKARSLIAIEEQINEATKAGDNELANSLRKEHSLYLEKFGINDYASYKANAINNGLKYQTMTVAYEGYLNSINALSKEVQRLTGQPVADLITYMCPFKATDKQLKNAQVIQTVKGMLNFDNKNPIRTTEGSIAFDFFNSSKAMIQELSKEYGITAIRDTLLDPSLNYASNESLINKTYELLSSEIDEEDYMIYDREPEKKQTYLEDMKYVFDAIGEYTHINKRVNSSLTIKEQYQTMWKELSNNTEVLISKFNDDFDSEATTYSDFLTIANDRDTDVALRERAQTVANYMWAKMICAQGIIESSPKFAQRFTDYINSLYKDGYSLVNQFGQKYERGQWMKPLTTSSMANLKDNLGISYHSNNEQMWNQFLLEKIISGEVYTLRNDVVDYLDKNVYTRNNGNNLTRTLKEISKWSSAIQMAIPSKLINRLISFTGFDYSMGISYDPKTLKYIGKARRDLLAAYQSKGATMDPVLERYMQLEGQPIGLTGKDPITFSEELNGPDQIMKILNTMTDPLEFQNHLGRYAIYLTALEGFENGDANYGPLYYRKDAIDNSNLTNEEKAMYVMDYMLGSPNGGFPMLAKKTSGYMLYATFPMAFTRTLGAYGMSIGKLAQEGFTQDNAKQWMRTVGNPGMGVLAITGLAALVTSLVCDLYGVEEDEKEKLLKKHVTLDPLGTLIGGTPTASSSSMNPYSNLEEMFITPFKNDTYSSVTDSPTIFDKLKGFTNVNILSHLNPAFKTPVELLSGKDIYAAAPIDTKYYYTGTENAARKLMGFFIGSSMANALVDQYKMDTYDSDSTFLDSLKTGVKRGIANSVGNQKTYKKDTTNYYNNIYKINNYKYANTVYSDAEAEDLMDANYLDKQRNYSGKYGDYDKDDYKRISNILRKMINNKAEPTEVYGVIVSEYNNGVSEATLRVVLNNCSIVRKLKQIDTRKYLQTLSPKERASLSAAIEYEERMYPDLEKFFPDSIFGKKHYLPSRKKYYNSSSSPSGKVPYIPKYSPKLVYPNSSSYYTKYNSSKPKASINRVKVEVSPQMGVWTKDYNKTKDLRTWQNSDYNRTKPMSHGGGK